MAGPIEACTALFIDYARFVDFGDYDQFVALFTEDAVLDLGFRLEGRGAIERSMSRRDPQLRSRHILSNIHVEVNSNTQANGIAYLSLYRHIGQQSLDPSPVLLSGPAAIGHYDNTFRLTSQGWRIASCKLQFAFQDLDQF